MGAKLEIYFNILGNAYIFVRTVPLEVFVGGGAWLLAPYPVTTLVFMKSLNVRFYNIEILHKTFLH